MWLLEGKKINFFWVKKKKKEVWSSLTIQQKLQNLEDKTLSL